MERERKAHNVDKFDRIRGGVPEKGRGRIRANSLGEPGQFNYPDIHNLKINPNPDSPTVDSRDKIAFNRYINEDKLFITRRENRPWFIAHVDYNYFNYDRYKLNLKIFRNLIIFTFLFYAIIKTKIKKNNRVILDRLYRYTFNS